MFPPCSFSDRVLDWALSAEEHLPGYRQAEAMIAVVSDWPMTCTCGAPSAEGPETLLEERSPCPACGSFARAVHVTVNDGARATDSVSWSLSLVDGPRPWQEMWAIAEHGLEEIEALYGGRSGFDTTTVMSVVYSYCINCYHFKDHLKKDGSVPMIACQGVEAYVDSCSALTLCGDVANTIKHRTRVPVYPCTRRSLGPYCEHK